MATKRRRSSRSSRPGARGIEVTFPRDELRQVVESFKYFPYDLFPKAWQTAAVHSAERVLKAALGAGRFPATVRLTPMQLEAASESVDMIGASGGGPEDLFSTEWAREPRLRAAWYRAADRLGQLVKRLGRAAWEMI